MLPDFAAVAAPGPHNEADDESLSRQTPDRHGGKLGHFEHVMPDPHFALHQRSYATL